MSKTIDARGLSCPAPVLLVKDTIEKEAPASLEVIVDNPASRENVGRFLASKGYAVSESSSGSDFVLRGESDGSVPVAEAAPASKARPGADENQKVMVLVASDVLGRGDDELGRKLMVAYLKTIAEMGDELWHLVFVNGGVKLTTKDSPVLEELRRYEESGVTVLACGTCLEHFGLTGDKVVGTTTNMLDIVSATRLADKVITIA